ncbi:hypothetical protein ADL00_27570 [Streptomyces sp. AS58]|nr:hypothetical protein ADL00_27570 [Streptomyces sp. AS58]
MRPWRTPCSMAARRGGSRPVSRHRRAPRFARRVAAVPAHAPSWCVFHDRNPRLRQGPEIPAVKIDAQRTYRKCEACEDCRGNGGCHPTPGYPARSADPPARPHPCTHAPRTRNRCSAPARVRAVTGGGCGS